MTNRKGRKKVCKCAKKWFKNHKVAFHQVVSDVLRKDGGQFCVYCNNKIKD